MPRLPPARRVALFFAPAADPLPILPERHAPVHLRLLDLDGSLPAASALARTGAWSSVDTVPLRDLAPALRLWARDATMRRARGRLGQSGPTLTLIGSGDFHHLAVPLIAQARETVTVVHFDNHPDWVRWAPRWHCGSWVNQALALPHVARVVTAGPCSDDLVRPQLKGGNVAALGAGRLVLFPWRHAPSRLFGRIADGPGHRCADGHLVWRNLADCDSDERLALLLGAIETPSIWLTIDKDVLAETDALTNWDQGQMPLAALLELVAGLVARKRVCGADICGEYSVPVLSNLAKRIESRFDRPQRVADPARLARNAEVDRCLLQAIAGTARC
jgi:arginase family enzyme